MNLLRQDKKGQLYNYSLFIASRYFEYDLEWKQVK